MGEFFRTIGGHMPQPPAGAEPPLLWGSEDHVRDLFAGTGVELTFAREVLEFPRLETIDEEIEFATTKFGPLIMARRILEPQQRWQPLLDDLRRLMEESRPAEYLVVTGTKA
jgi:hypothetical protein